MVSLYKWMPDIKNFREAVFCGHFGPIGIGARLPYFLPFSSKADLIDDTGGIFISTLATQIICKSLEVSSSHPSSSSRHSLAQITLLEETIKPSLCSWSYAPSPYMDYPFPLSCCVGGCIRCRGLGLGMLVFPIG